MSKILVVADHKSGSLKDSTKELLGFASGLGAEVSAVVIGSGVSTVADEAAGQGAATVYVADDASLEVYSTALYTGLVVDAAQQSGATQIWLTSTEIGRDLTPRVAARLDVGALSDVTKLEVNGEHITAYRPCMATKLVQEVRFKHDGIRVLSIRAGSFEVIEKAPTSANAVSLALPEADSRLEPLGVEVEVSNEISLNEAPIVVSVGRGAGGPDGCESVRPLAQQMGAAFGASRGVAIEAATVAGLESMTMILNWRAISRAPAALAVSLLLLAACSQPPAPVIMGGSNTDSTPLRPLVKPESRMTEGSGNATAPLPRMKPRLSRNGTNEVASDAGVAQVQAGDTVYALSRLHHVGVRDIIRANRLKPPYKLVIRQTIRLPKAQYHIVHAGETLYGLSEHYGVDMSAMVRANNIPAPYRLIVGQHLRLPGANAKLAQDIPRTAKQTVAAAPEKQARKGIPGKPPPLAGKYFLWPAEGRLLSSFGPKEGGLHNDGINFAVPRGAPLRASLLQDSPARPRD